jgi:hypothetical protein
MSDQLDAGLDAERAALKEHYRAPGIGALSSAFAERLAQPMHPLRFQGSWFTLACELTLDIRDRGAVRPSGPANFALNVWTLLSRCTECAEEVALQNKCWDAMRIRCLPYYADRPCRNNLLGIKGVVEAGER